MRAADGPWLLVNASPDVRVQLEALWEGMHDNGVRPSPVAAVLLTDAEIDHTSGLVVLRESGEPLRVFGTDPVRRALTDGYPILRVLEKYAGIEWHDFVPGERLQLPGGLEVEPFAVAGDAPLYLGGRGEAGVVGLSFRERANGGIVTYAPAVGEIDDALLERFAASDCVFVDGTFWSNDELPALGISTRTALDMGHVPLGGPEGSLVDLATLGRPRMILVHVNNTNPILLEGSAERRAVEAAGLEVAEDGLEVEV